MFRIPAIGFLCEQAKKRADKLGALKGSIRKGKGNYVGYLFQCAYSMLYNCEWSDEFNYDLTSPTGEHIECKSKERTIQYIDVSWETSIADHAGLGSGQKCDKYVFGSVSVERNSKRPQWIWFLGEIPKQQYFMGRASGPQIEGETDSHNRPLIRWENMVDGAEFRKKGLPYDDNDFTCNEDCWNRRIDYLDPLDLKDVTNKTRLKNIVKQSREERWGGFEHNGEFIRPSIDHLMGSNEVRNSS
jgi:hypothetical protein